MPIPAHPLKTIGPEVGDEDIPVPVKCQSVWQCAGQKTGSLTFGIVKKAGSGLGDQFLVTVRFNSHDPAAGIGNPQVSVFFGKYALRTVKIFSNKTNVLFSDFEIQYGIMFHDPFLLFRFS
jgi:hypothetical protein